MKKRLTLLMFFLTLLLTHCNDNENEPEGISLTINIPIDQLNNVMLSEILITNGDTTFSKEMILAGNFVTATFENLFPDEWTYSAKVNLMFPDLTYGEDNEYTYSYEENCANRIDYLTWRRVDTLGLTRSHVETVTIPGETGWELYYGERSTSGDYVFLPMMNTNFPTNQVPNKIFKVFIELSQNPEAAPARPDLNLYGIAGHHSWNYYYALKIYNQNTLIFDNWIELSYCGSGIDNCNSNVGGKQRLIDLQFDSSDFIDLPSENWTYWSWISINRDTNPSVPQFRIDKNLIFEKYGIDDIGYDPYPCASVKSI